MRTRARTTCSTSGPKPRRGRSGSPSGSATAPSRRAAIASRRSSSLSLDLRRRLVFALLGLAGAFRRVLTRSENTYRLLFVPGFEGMRWRFGKWRAWMAFERARRSTPAYREFLAEHGDPRVRVRGLDPDLTTIPMTDKNNYVRRWPVEARCRGGRIPSSGVVIDESSGTSGKPNNWVRGPAELAEVRQALQVALHHQLGRGEIFVLNAFALGPWATGMNVSMSVVDIAILKSVGPDVAKIENTLALFGPRYRYLICGYPPFLKTLVDVADMDWSQYDVTAIFGGEGMSEAGELVVTLCRTQNAAPKIRYNIRDLGHVVRFRELRSALAEARIEPRELAPRHSDLPLLFLYGRADAAVPYFGCKITPANLEDVVCSLPDLAPIVNSFALLVSEDEDATKRLAIALELREGAAAPAEVEGLRAQVLARLAEVNQDFREASRFMPPESVPTLEFHRAGAGPFAGYDVRLKRHYVQRREAR